MSTRLTDPHAARGPAPRHAARITLTGLLAGAALMATACGGTQGSRVASDEHAGTPVSARTASVALPSTPAGAQARWLLGAAPHAPIPTAELRAHFDAQFLAQVSPAQLNQGIQTAIGSAATRVASIRVSRPRALEAVLAVSGGQLVLALSVDGRGLIDGARLAPVRTATPQTWGAVDAQLRTVAPQIHMVVARVRAGSCETIHGMAPAQRAPLGSAFKLYVLDALGRAIAAHRLSWSTRLAVTAQLKSLSSGVLQNLPDGTRVTVRDAAAKMISISDNTAANMLIAAVGRRDIERNLGAAGMADPSADVPFLNTRELFILKLRQYPALAARYLQADPAGRRAVLRSIDRLPLPSSPAISQWTTPRNIGGLEWFASPQDICRAYASLAGLARRPGLAPIAQVLQINDAGLGLDRAKWRTTWYKGGSEIGVLTLSYLATTRDGRSYVVSVLTANPSSAISEAAATPRIQSAIRGAFALAVR